MVLLVNVTLPLFQNPAPNEAELSERVLPVTVALPELKNPPPVCPRLFESVLPVSVTLPELQIAPPNWAEFDENVLPETVTFPELNSPPPLPPELDVMRSFWRVSVPALLIPAPELALPPVIVRPLIAAVTPKSTTKTPLVLLPLMATCPAPGPAMVTVAAVFASSSFVPARTIVVRLPAGKTVASKVIVAGVENVPA